MVEEVISNDDDDCMIIAQGKSTCGVIAPVGEVVAPKEDDMILLDLQIDVVFKASKKDELSFNNSVGTKVDQRKKKDPMEMLRFCQTGHALIMRVCSLILSVLLLDDC